MRAGGEGSELAFNNSNVLLRQGVVGLPSPLYSAILFGTYFASSESALRSLGGLILLTFVVNSPQLRYLRNRFQVLNLFSQRPVAYDFAMAAQPRAPVKERNRHSFKYFQIFQSFFI